MIKYPFLDLKTANEPYAGIISAAMERVAASGRYIGGPEVENFEKALAAHTGTAYAVGCANGLDALRLILRAYMELGRLQPGDEVIVPANTYIATVLAISDNGLKPVLVEPRIDTLNIDTSLLEQAITDRTRVIMPVHLYGRACHDSTLDEVARRHNLLVVEDNAQAIGARSPLDGRRTGSLGHAAAFSFYPTKNLGALGDGGAVTTDDAQLARAVRALANYGSDRRYHNIYKGLNSRLDPLQAAILRDKLPLLDDENAHRRAIAATYDRYIHNKLIAKPMYAYNEECVWHQYVIMTPRRDDLRRYLEDNGVATDIHYAVPPHRQPCYSSELSELSLPVTDMIAHSVLSLPVSRCTSPDDAREIAMIINRFDL